MDRVKIAVAGVGNNAAALYQGAAFYRAFPDAPGLMSRDVGPYGPESVEVVAAFDVDVNKIGWPLAQAIFEEPNCVAALPGLRLPEGPAVCAAPVEDGLGRSALQRVQTGNARSWRGVREELGRSGADVLVNFLPVGSERATMAYAEAALDVGCAFVNAIPVFLARRAEWRARFFDVGLPLIGDDIKSQVGATVLHRALAEVFSDRGARLERTYQVNFGGGSDFVNMQDLERLGTKRVSKTTAVTDVANGGAGLPEGDVYVGPAGVIPYLGDDKVAHISLEGSGFAANRLEVEVRYRGGDSPNAAAVAFDAVRYAKLALDAGISGALAVPSAVLMKAPPELTSSDGRAAEALKGWELEAEASARAIADLVE